jgi:hypothetical protein
MGADFALLVTQVQLGDARSRIRELEADQKQLEARVREQKRVIGDLTRELGNAMRPQDVPVTKVIQD